MERKCKNCGNNAWCDGKSPITDICIECRYVDVNGHQEPSNWKPQAMTNADRIRSMTDEELAEFICSKLKGCIMTTCPGEELCNGTDGKANGLKKWLQQPAEEE